MNKKQAIQIASEYINKQNNSQPANIDTQAILDGAPIELRDFGVSNRTTKI